MSNFWNSVKKFFDKMFFREGDNSRLSYWMDYHNARLDKCIKNEIYELNESHNIHTTGSCCGHGKKEGYNSGFISVASRKDETKMLKLGYVRATDTGALVTTHNGNFTTRLTFKPKSICKCKGKRDRDEKK